MSALLTIDAEVEHLIPADWADLASVFAHAFNIRSLRPLSMRETQSLKVCKHFMLWLDSLIHLF